MVNVCEEYGKEFHATFNDKKTTGMVFGTSNVAKPYRLMETMLTENRLLPAVEWRPTAYRAEDR